MADAEDAMPAEEQPQLDAEDQQQPTPPGEALEAQNAEPTAGDMGEAAQEEQAEAEVAAVPDTAGEQAADIAADGGQDAAAEAEEAGPQPDLQEDDAAQPPAADAGDALAEAGVDLAAEGGEQVAMEGGFQEAAQEPQAEEPAQELPADGQDYVAEGEGYTEGGQAAATEGQDLADGQGYFEGQEYAAGGLEQAAVPTDEQYVQQEGAEPEEVHVPVDETGYQEQLPHAYYPTAPVADGEQLAADAQLDEQQYAGVQQPVPSGMADEQQLLEEQRRALEAENAALLAEQAALDQQEGQPYMDQALPEEQYHEQAHEMAYQAAGDAQYDQAAADAQYDQAAVDAQYADTHYTDAYGQLPEDTYGAAMYSEAPQPAAAQEMAPAAPAIDIDALLAEEREKHEQQLKLETRAREELEDMILRIEKHFKAEQAARKKAEELLQQAIAAEMDAKNKLEDVMKRRGQEQRLLEEERNAITRERHALESMRQEFENELQAARSEVAKAQEALAGSEERIRSAEQVERARLESEYQSKLASMQAEMDRMRDEMTYRTMVMQDEMENWRQQAQITANAVLEAKGEVMERKRELDSTKEKMDRLLDKLLMGRERGIELSGAIASNQRMLGFLPGMAGYGMPQMGGMGPSGVPGGPVSLPPMGGQMKMPPMAPQGPWMNGFPMPGPPVPLQQQASLPAGGRPPKLPPLGGGYPGGGWSPDASPGPQQRRAASADNAPDYSVMDDGPYAHVQSRFAQGAAEVGLAAKAKQRGGPAGARNANTRAKKADRFEEAEKEAKRNAAMSRWN